jgi:type IX secretion system PorP/SprF family membrane protein
MNILNPAYAGVNEKAEIGIGFRKQQADFDDGSTTQYISYSKALGRNLGVGVSIVNDKVFISKETSIAIDASYKLQLDRVNNFYFGMKVGGAFHTMDFNSLGVNDPLFSSNESTFSPLVGLGAYLKGERYFVNVSSTNVILSEVQKPRLNSKGKIISDSVKEKLHVYIGAGYRFSVTETIDLTPSVFSRFVMNEDLLLDISAVADFSNKIEAGLTYRLNTSVIASVMLKLIKNTSFGYAYESTTSEYSTASSGTHEFVMKFAW